MYKRDHLTIYLIGRDGRHEIDLGRGMVTIGRHPQCDIRLESGRVSRRHCCLTEVDGEVRVSDLGSTNGIRINGRRVQSGRLKPGDELSIGHFRYFVELAGAEASLA